MKGTFFLLFFSLSASSQISSDSAWQKSPSIHFGAFVDTYYGFDFAEPKKLERQSFLYNHNRHNDFNINLGLVSLKLKHEKYRGNLGLHVGTYANDNYSAEPKSLQFINEANVGMSISKKNKLWVDFGVLPSYIGFESAVSIVNPTLTRSLVAESSPYFVTGVQFTYKPSQKWSFASLVMNGWQNIQRLPQDDIPSFGTQIQFTPNKSVLVNWSTYLGSINPDINSGFQYFNNFYARFKVKEKWEFIVGADFGIKALRILELKQNPWGGLVGIGQMKLNEKWKLGIRGEYYKDASQVIIQLPFTDSFSTFSSSMNIDFMPIKNFSWRLEGRLMRSPNEIFIFPGILGPTTNFFICTSFAILLDKEVK